MNTTPRLIAVLPALTLALLGLAAPAAQASTRIYPGSMCSSDGPVDRPTWGGLLNAGSGASSYHTFSCPIPRTHNGSSLLTVSLNTKLSTGNAQFLCAVRSVMLDGTQIIYEPFILPAYSNNNGGNWSTNGVQLFGLPGVPWMAFLRCQVPNGSTRGGIVSYSVTE